MVIAERDPAHFVARAGHAIPLLKRRSASDLEEEMLQGIRLWPSNVVMPEGLALFGRERGRFDRELLVEALRCGLPANLPPDAQFVVLHLNDAAGIVVPVFLTSESDALEYFEVSVDSPGPPVVLVIDAYKSFALRVLTSPATNLVAVHSDTQDPSVVLGVPRERVTQRYRDEGSDPACAYRREGGGPPPEYMDWLSPDSSRITHVVAESGSEEAFRIVIGSRQALDQKAPTLQQFFDSEMPASGNYGLAILVKRGFIRQRESDGGDVVFEIRKPFRLPGGLYGSQSVMFEVPRGVAPPSGDLGHSDISWKEP